MFSGYKVIHQEVHLIEAPLYLVRKYFLVDDVTKDIPIQITISLAWDGFKCAVDFLFGFTEALDLFFNPDKVIDTRAFSLGDFGVAWGWVSEEIDVLAFIRNNVFVGIQGFLPKERMISAAKAIDAEIHHLGTTSHYIDDQPGFFTQIRARNGNLSIHPGERLDIGLQPPGHETYFFMTTDGCMNRDFARPDVWYFRAGKEVGLQQITLFRVDEGILPQKECLSIAVVEA